MLANLLQTVLGDASAGAGNFGHLMDPTTPAPTFQPRTYSTAPAPLAPMSPGRGNISPQQLSPQAQEAYSRRGMGLQELLGSFQMPNMPQVATPENNPALFHPPLQLGPPKRSNVKPPAPPPGKPGWREPVSDPEFDPMNFVGGLGV